VSKRRTRLNSSLHDIRGHSRHAALRALLPGILLSARATMESGTDCLQVNVFSEFGPRILVLFPGQVPLILINEPWIWRPGRRPPLRSRNAACASFTLFPRYRPSGHPHSRSQYHPGHASRRIGGSILSWARSPQPQSSSNARRPYSFVGLVAMSASRPSFAAVLPKAFFELRRLC